MCDTTIVAVVVVVVVVVVLVVVTSHLQSTAVVCCVELIDLLHHRTAHCTGVACRKSGTVSCPCLGREGRGVSVFASKWCCRFFLSFVVLLGSASFHLVHLCLRLLLLHSHV